ncbi:MAG: Twin-arginine translocation protein TatA [uncultured Thermomicrobiales bacterium]|uniref:Sec-independent protein translocase protein TatA n=1 Tax=uncultured Thermomicrobiales bacterium TaxID=1645740 RepID=A0A6J4UBM5_9BACT|nr:MAG: Twin-arginine translocation protein TatA [uncultured Thermomicrobiales bacterium]
MGGLGWQELLIVMVIIMIIFGAGKLPDVARSLGQGVKEFKKESSDLGGTIASSSSTGATTTTTVERERGTDGRVIETREMRAEEI